MPQASAAPGRSVLLTTCPGKKTSDSAERLRHALHDSIPLIMCTCNCHRTSASCMQVCTAQRQA